jgi:hypothetical protein
MTNPFRKRVPFPIKRKKLSIAENPKTLFRTRLGSSNVSFKYLYRDASNYKLHGEAVFTNHTFLPIDEIEKQIHSCLKDGEFFIDHPWHEFNLVEMTTEPAFDPENWNQHKHKRDITEFIAELEKANRVGWDELKVPADVAGMQEKQKEKLKQTLESGKDILK